jgi:hypothetical protein
VREVRAKGFILLESIESTTDLPLEIQTALEDCSRRTKRSRADQKILPQVLRRAQPSRVEPFAEFTAPRARAARDPKNRIHGGRQVARFRRRGDPSSLEFVKGFEPDFARGIFEVNQTKSHLYHGELRRFRILSKNRKIQYLFLAGPQHVWIIPPQALTTELSTFGLRLVDVAADEDLFIPGYEYHYVDASQGPARPLQPDSERVRGRAVSGRREQGGCVALARGPAGDREVQAGGAREAPQIEPPQMSRITTRANRA